MGVSRGASSSRFPRGKRGLKSNWPNPCPPEEMSLPSREAWIEIAVKLSSMSLSWRSLPPREAWIEIATSNCAARSLCRFLRGKRGEIPAKCCIRRKDLSCFSRGKRGLKYEGTPRREPEQRSLPSREAWIEIASPLMTLNSSWSFPSREAGGRTFGGFGFLSSASQGPIAS